MISYSPARIRSRRGRAARPWRAALGATVVGAVALALGLVSPSSARAQSGEGYLFGSPPAHIDFFLGIGAPRARGALFDQTMDRYTLERDDLRSAAFGGSLGLRVTERVDVAAEIGFARSSTDVEDRIYEGTDGLPIVHTVELTRVPLSLVMRGYLWERGRQVGRLAWVPRAWAPYLGAGLGITWYEFVQDGEFVDENDPALPIYRDVLTWDGAAPTAHLLGGVEVNLNPRLLLRGEGRYSWAEGDDRSRDYVGFEGVDLAGFQAVVGLTLRLGGTP